ncbi:MAG: hypothetical protein ACQETH_04415 [Candidatus Rifleibacteriota bacterium]
MHSIKTNKINLNEFLITISVILFLAVQPVNASQLDLPTCAYTIRDMVQDKQGNIFTGTFGAGLWLINEREITRLRNLEQEGLYPMISNLMIDKNKLWVATTGDGCNYITLADLKFHKVNYPQRFSRLHALHKTQDNKILIGSVGSGAAILKKNQSNYYWKPVSEKVLNHISWINDIKEWNNKIWLATANGVYHIAADHAVENWQPRSEGLKSGANQFFPDNDRLFISTTSRGVFVKDGEKQPVPVANIYGEIYFVTRFNNSLIAGGERGLWKIEKNKGRKVKSFHDHCAKSYLVTQKNSLLIGTMDGRIIETKNLKNFKLLAHLQVESIEELNK